MRLLLGLRAFAATVAIIIACEPVAPFCGQAVGAVNRTVAA